MTFGATWYFSRGPACERAEAADRRMTELNRTLRSSMQKGARGDVHSIHEPYRENDKMNAKPPRALHVAVKPSPHPLKDQSCESI